MANGYAALESEMKSKAQILEEFSLFSVPTGGIGSWLTEQTHDILVRQRAVVALHDLLGDPARQDADESETENANAVHFSDLVNVTR